MTECFLSDIKNKAKMPGLTISLLNTLLDVLDRVIKQEKEKKKILQTGKEVAKVLLFADDLVLYVETLVSKSLNIFQNQ